MLYAMIRDALALIGAAEVGWWFGQWAGSRLGDALAPWLVRQPPR